MKRRTLLTSGAAAAALFTTGCMGKFALTTGLYKWNDTVTGNKIVNNLIFWALGYIIPVYGLALFGDMFILNVIEFWTGSNLMAVKDEAQKTKLAVRGDHLEITHRGHTFTATRVDARTVVVRRGNLILGSAIATEKGMVMTGPDGIEKAAFSLEELEAMDRELEAALS